MSKAKSTDSINALILSLEHQSKQDFHALKQQLKVTGESLKPVNLIKSAVAEVTGNKELKTYLIQAGVGIALSFFAKKLLVNSKANTASSLIGGAAVLGLKRLTPAQATLIRLAAPIVFGFVVKTIKKIRKK
ncbi:MAG: hypothetical protein ABJC12_02225 [Saprospiraceae bacterium]